MLLRLRGRVTIPPSVSDSVAFAVRRADDYANMLPFGAGGLRRTNLCRRSRSSCSDLYAVCRDGRPQQARSGSAAEGSCGADLRHRTGACSRDRPRVGRQTPRCRGHAPEEWSRASIGAAFDQCSTTEIHVGDLEALAADPDVLSISSDAPVYANAVKFDLTHFSEREALLATLGLDEQPFDGDKVTIAVVDSGLDETADLGGGRADRFFDFVSTDRNSHARDDYGHGTHVAGLIRRHAETTQIERSKRGLGR